MTILSNPLGVEVGLKYTIIGPDGTRASFNDSTDADFCGFLNGEDGVTGLERAGVRESADVIPEADGGVHGAFRYDRLPFTLKGIVPPDSVAGGTWLNRQAAILRATNAMRADALLQWAPSEAPPVQVSFRQQQPTRITGRRPKTFLIAGVAEVSTVQSQALRSLAIALTGSSSGGMVSPMVSPLGSAQASSGSGTATTLGSAEAWPLLTFTGPVVNPTLTSLRYGRTIRLAYTLAAGETLVVDTDPRRRSILLNGDANASRYSALDWLGSVWFPLAPGDNILQAGASSFSSPAAVTVQWRDAWG